MKTLEFPFIKNGFNHELLKREGLVCLVKRSKPAHWHFEIIKLKVAPQGIIMGKEYPEREIYPNDEDFGTLGFSIPSNRSEEANAAFRGLAVTLLQLKVGSL